MPLYDRPKETPEKRLFYPLANVLFLSSRPKGEISPLYDNQREVCTLATAQQLQKIGIMQNTTDALRSVSFFLTY